MRSLDSQKKRGNICRLTHEAAPDPSGAAYYYRRFVKNIKENKTLNLAFANYLYQNADFLDTALDSVQYTHQYWIFLMPLILAGADIVTGWIQASINATWDSTKMRKGLFRKGGELLVVVLAFVTEYALEVAAHAHIATFVSVYIIVMEALSVLENLDQAGVPIPPIIRDRLGKVKHDMDGGVDNA